MHHFVTEMCTHFCYKMEDCGVLTWCIVEFVQQVYMMTSSNGNIFRVAGPVCGEFTGPGEFHAQRPATRSFGVFFQLRLSKRLSKQPRGWWFETPPWSLWRQCNVGGISLLTNGRARLSYCVSYETKISTFGEIRIFNFLRNLVIFPFMWTGNLCLKGTIKNSNRIYPEQWKITEISSF